ELDAIGQAARLDLPQSGQKPWMSAALCARLAAFDWPGNVRQLRNVARQLAIASRESDVVQLRPSVERLLADAATDEPSSSASDPPSSAGDASATATRRRPSEISEPELLHALRSHRWQVQGAAGELAISRAALYKLMERSPKVRKADDLSREEIETSRERCAGDPTAMVEALEVSWPALRRRMKRLGLD
ncbi:MAG: sigma-54-dependent Fis family transcriptional regulator, partial [Acidobacteriota bacterium]